MDRGGQGAGGRLSGSHAGQLFSSGSPRDMPPSVVYRVFYLYECPPKPNPPSSYCPDPLGLRAQVDGLVALWGFAYQAEGPREHMGRGAPQAAGHQGCLKVAAGDRWYPEASSVLSGSLCTTGDPSLPSVHRFDDPVLPSQCLVVRSCRCSRVTFGSRCWPGGRPRRRPKHIWLDCSKVVLRSAVEVSLVPGGPLGENSDLLHPIDAFDPLGQAEDTEHGMKDPSHLPPLCSSWDPRLLARPNWQRPWQQSVLDQRMRCFTWIFGVHGEAHYIEAHWVATRLC